MQSIVSRLDVADVSNQFGIFVISNINVRIVVNFLFVLLPQSCSIVFSLRQTKYMIVCTADVWFGLMSNQTDNVFRWIDDASNMTFAQWDINQPNKTSMAGMTHRSVGGIWKTNDLASTLHKYVCQLRICKLFDNPVRTQIKD